MTKERVYEIWRPAESPWGRWVKPVLFSFLREQELVSPRVEAPNWPIPLETSTAIIADLPGAEAVGVGAALARSGYRPIPLYNARPWATVAKSLMNVEPSYLPAVVDAVPIMTALCATAKGLAETNLPTSAPPVFLLDSNRQGWDFAPPPGIFLQGWLDNRSYISSSDLPSSNFFKEHGISQIAVLHSEPRLHADLEQVLFGLQLNGLSICQQRAWDPWSPRLMRVRRPPAITRIWNRAPHALGYRPNSLDPFGTLMPPPSAG